MSGNVNKGRNFFVGVPYIDTDVFSFCWLDDSVPDQSLAMLAKSFFNFRPSLGYFDTTLFAKLGGLSAPAIKMAVFEGDTASFADDVVSIVHGLSPTKIISIAVRVDNGLDDVYFDNSIVSLETSILKVSNLANDGIHLLGKPYYITVTYRQ
jgi:hypothetical protein